MFQGNSACLIPEGWTLEEVFWLRSESWIMRTVLFLKALCQGSLAICAYAPQRSGKMLKGKCQDGGFQHWQEDGSRQVKQVVFFLSLFVHLRWDCSHFVAKVLLKVWQFSCFILSSAGIWWFGESPSPGWSGSAKQILQLPQKLSFPSCSSKICQSSSIKTNLFFTE